MSLNKNWSVFKVPLLKFDLLEGKTNEEIENILDTVQEAVVEAFEVPASDRYQLVYQHKPEEMVVLDTGLGFGRSENLLVISVTSKERSKEKKIKFYNLAAKYLKDRCGIPKQDIVINITENQDPDWSFGEGKAQFMTEEL